MQDRVTVQLYKLFVDYGFGVLRFNFRGIGRSQGVFDNGMGELSDAASALDYLQAMNPNAEQCWVGGYSFGAWIGLQLLMRRPEIDGFIAVRRRPTTTICRSWRPARLRASSSTARATASPPRRTWSA